MFGNQILRVISNWFSRNFSDPAALGLFFTVFLIVILLQFFGQVLAPLLVSIIFAYLLQPVVNLLERWKMPHLLAVNITFFLFLGFLIAGFFILLPLLWHQLISFVHEFPILFNKAQTIIDGFLKNYPGLFDYFQASQLSTFLQEQTSKAGHFVVSISIASLSGLMQWVLYVVMVPLLVFFLLKDRAVLMQWASQFLPSHRSLLKNVAIEVNDQMGHYVRGRIIEIIIVSLVTWLVFRWLGLQYAGLLSVLVGVSVIVPYIGAVVVTIPVIILALVQWGLTTSFVYLVIAYSLII